MVVVMTMRGCGGRGFFFCSKFGGRGWTSRASLRLLLAWILVCLMGVDGSGRGTGHGGSTQADRVGSVGTFSLLESGVEWERDRGR